MKHETFVEKVVTPTLVAITELVGSKGDEYASTNAFHNFINAVELSRTSETSIQTLEGMQLKHTMSIRDIVNTADAHLLADIDGRDGHPKIKFTKAQIREKFQDFIVYEILKMGIVLETFGYITDENLNEAI